MPQTRAMVKLRTAMKNKINNTFSAHGINLSKESLAAGYYGTGLTVGRHPMYFQQERMNIMGATSRNSRAP